MSFIKLTQDQPGQISPFGKSPLYVWVDALEVKTIAEALIGTEKVTAISFRGSDLPLNVLEAAASVAEQVMAARVAAAVDAIHAKMILNHPVVTGSGE